ncbi:MAG: hypothetical protein EOO73_08190 [Myxococcales bacterium]|nr:MAG: hypothetical protein EOO73_08190 [Myxococcales bacterium]
MTTDTADRYLATAFYSQYNLILLGGSALFSLASASPVPLALGCAAELLWLGVGPRLPVFKKRVDATLDGERRALLEDEVMAGMRSLSPQHSSRLLGVTQSISWITLRADTAATSPEDREMLLDLEELRPVFLRLCQLHERVTQRLEEVKLSPPEQEVADLSRAYAAEKDLGVRFTLHQGIKAAQKRIEQQVRWAELQRQVEQKLTIVEQALSHLVGQQQLGLSGSDLNREVQGIVAHVVMLPALEAELDA